MLTHPELLTRRPEVVSPDGVFLDNVLLDGDPLSDPLVLRAGCRRAQAR
jgi:hypothetical protein